MKSKIALFIFCSLIWVGLNWPPGWPLLVVGLVASALVAGLFGGLFVERPHQLAHFERYLWMLYYIPVFIWECFKANLDVAYRVAHPELPNRPGIVKVKTSLKSASGLTFLANSITLTPGTLTVDIDRENGFLYVHWIDVKSEEIEAATNSIVSRFERILKRVFE